MSMTVKAADTEALSALIEERRAGSFVSAAVMKERVDVMLERKAREHGTEEQ